MQKCLVFSDSHGAALLRMQRVIEAHTDAQVVFFLGDGLSEAEALVPMFPDRAFLFVRGNCDLAPLSAVEETDAVTLEGVRIVFTHGHKYGAKYSHGGLMALAAARGAEKLPVIACSSSVAMRERIASGDVSSDASHIRTKVISATIRLTALDFCIANNASSKSLQ